MTLRQYLEEHSESQSAFAERTGIDQSLISKYVSGKRRASGPNIATIEVATAGRVALKDWPGCGAKKQRAA